MTRTTTTTTATRSSVTADDCRLVADARDNYVPQRAEHALWCGHTAPSATEHLLCSCWTRTMQQSSITPERGRLIMQQIPAVTKDILVCIVGPWRSVNYFNCTV